MLVMFGILLAILIHVFGDMSLDLIVLAVTACIPTIWIARNKRIIQDFISYFNEHEIHDEEHNDVQDEWGGVWLGPQERGS